MANTTVAPAEGLPRQQRLNSRYRIVGELGTGAFGLVCVGEDTTTGTPVAIRLLPTTAARARGGDVLERISPAIISASAAHPAIVRILDAGRADSGRPFVVMEFVEGRRLSDVLASGPTPDVPTALAMALELGGAVETGHNMGLVHGALRSRNVIVLADGGVKLMDLELAGLRDGPPMRVARAEEAVETSDTEPVRDEVITEKTDIYAFAAIVYEMLCGAPPFSGATPDAAAPSKQGSQRLAWPRDRRGQIPASVRRIIEEALSEEPERRPFMSQLLNALVLKPGVTAGSRRRVAMAAAAAVGTVAVGLLGWGLLGPRLPGMKAPVFSTRPAAPKAVQMNRSIAAPAPVAPTTSPARETPTSTSASTTPREATPAAVGAPTRVTTPPAPLAASRQTPPTPPARLTAPAHETVSPAPVAPPSRVTTPTSAPRTAAMPPRESTPPRPESASPRQESVSPRRESPPPAPAAAPTRRPTSADDGYDPAAVIDWVLSEGKR
jgi:eukaryotic-like serine/threonine-protein kinase